MTRVRPGRCGVLLGQSSVDEEGMPPYMSVFQGYPKKEGTFGDGLELLTQERPGNRKLGQQTRPALREAEQPWTARQMIQGCEPLRRPRRLRHSRPTRPGLSTHTLQNLKPGAAGAQRAAQGCTQSAASSPALPLGDRGPTRSGSPGVVPARRAARARAGRPRTGRPGSPRPSGPLSAAAARPPRPRARRGPRCSGSAAAPPRSARGGRGWARRAPRPTGATAPARPPAAAAVRLQARAAALGRRHVAARNSARVDTVLRTGQGCTQCKTDKVSGGGSAGARC